MLRAQSASQPVWTVTPFGASADDLRAASAAVPVSHNDGVEVLYEEGIYKIADDGTLTYTHRLIFRVDAQDSVDGWSEVSAQWDPWFEKPADLQARVLEGDGRFVELDQKTVTDAPVKGDDVETYSSEHVRRAPLPGVAVGSIVEEQETITEKTPYFAGGGEYRYSFRQGVPVARERMVVDLPMATPFHDAIHLLPGLDVQRSESGGRRHVVYEATALPASHRSDIDLSTNTPNDPMVEFATGASWKAVASTYAAISEPLTVAEDTQPILPATLPAERMARIQAIVARLHEEVRYTGVEFGAARLTPMRPSEVIQRHYGDCKDKATLLVAMLRQAGVPANLALLSTGPGRDADAALPGMSQFDHAIVYVPAAGKDAALWIDATAEFFQPGILPFMDAGRSALIIAPETVGLTKTPAAEPQNSTLVETREFTLAQWGPSQVTETSETHGIIDANYRAEYGGSDDSKTRAGLESYAQGAYYAKSLSKVTHGDPQDLSQPFQLKLSIDGARRGTTTMDEAVVAIFTNMVLDSLPHWFATAPPVLGPDTPAEIRRQWDVAAQARTTSYVYQPFVDERRIRIVAPEGFALRSLPPEKTTQLGAATFTESYTSPSPGVVVATLKLDSGPGTLTAEQALAMRTAVVEFGKREYTGIFFDQSGAKAFADGHIRTALDTDRALIVAHPGEPLHHVRLARLLLQAGIGDEAHAEALKATQLDPKSATAFATYGWTLEHDSLGVRFGRGYDLAGAIAAYKKSNELDPDDNDSRFDLAILYEFNARGIRYGAGADLPAAMAMYRALIDKNKDKDANLTAQYQSNLAYVMLFARKFDELDALLATLPTNNARAALAIASATANHGVAAGVAAADKGNVESGDRSKNLLAAGAMLAQMQLYPESSQILSAGVSGGDDAPQTARQIEMYKNLKPASLAPLPASDPAGPVKTITMGILAGTLTEADVRKSLAREAYTTDASFEDDIQKNMAGVGLLRVVANKGDTSETVLLDVIGGGMTYTSKGDDATGYSILAETTGGDPSHYYVVREDGTYRVVADDGDFRPVGVAVLYALARGNPKQAKAMLDWKRGLVHRQGEDDDLAGPLLPRFWTVDSSKPDADSPAAMRLAAISLLAGSMDAKPYLAEIAADREKASGQRQTDLDLLLASAGVGAEQPEVSLPAAERLLEEDPDSLTALVLAGESYAMQNDSAGWLALLAPRLAKKPKDHDLLEQQERADLVAKNYSAARTAAQAVLDSDKAVGNDYNSYAWLGLFDGHVGEDALKAAQHSTEVSKSSNFADLHTLACIYAAEGRTTEARQTLDQAMYAGNQPEPNSEVWYALGMIYEQYGANDAALAAYRRVQAHEFDDHTYIDPEATYLLAQGRIQALTSGAAKTDSAR
jgi:tetratricopeptide (TPR) repeat protein/transglutaminase-like putative cysteine protease